MPERRIRYRVLTQFDGGLMRDLNKLNERGFTLIEMSIVLIIIGLIIGGILKGQELIESARQKNFISQLDSIKSGTNSFIDRFRSFPGDSALSSNICAVCAGGNDDGILGDAAAASTVATIMSFGTPHSGENYQFFNHLVGANFIGGGSANTVPAASFSGGAVPSPLPQAAFPQSGLTIVYGTHEGAGGGDGAATANWIRAHRFVAGAVTTAQAIVAPVRLSQLDLKFDDGVPTAGRIRSDGNGAGCGAGGAATPYGGQTNVTCSIIMQLE